MLPGRLHRQTPQALPGVGCPSGAVGQFTYWVRGGGATGFTMAEAEAELPALPVSTQGTAPTTNPEDLAPPRRVAQQGGVDARGSAQLCCGPAPEGPYHSRLASGLSYPWAPVSR